MNVLVLFGSQSDANVFEPLCEELKGSGHNVDFDVISAHRNPDELEVALKERKFDTVIAGAGLSAHLPGVIASKTKKPVFGIPVEAHFGGLDALFSIFQMPFGVPVFSCAPGRHSDIVSWLNAYSKLKPGRERKMNLVINEKLTNYEYVNQELDRTKDYMREREVGFKVVSMPVAGELNIVLVNADKEIYTDYEKHGLCVHTPIMDKNVKNSPAKALETFYQIKNGGLWVGVNNTRNAVCECLKFIEGGIA